MPEQGVPEQIPERLRTPQSEEDLDDRDRMMYRLRAYSHVTWPRLAEMFALSESGCRAAVTRYRETRGAVKVDEEVGHEVLMDSFASYDDMLEKASVSYANAKNESVAIGALSLRSRLVRERLDLCQQVGMLPRDLGTFRHVLDLEEAGRRIIDVLRRHDVPEAIQEAIVLALDGGEEPVDATVVG